MIKVKKSRSARSAVIILSEAQLRVAIAGTTSSPTDNRDDPHGGLRHQALGTLGVEASCVRRGTS
jgi:hypothetical protein